MKDATLTRLFLRFQSRHDGKALAAVFDASARELLGVAAHLVDDLDEAEDLVQTTFQIAIQKARHFDAQQSLKAWLYGILWREAAKVRRRAARRPRVDGLSEVRVSDPADEVLANEFPSVLRDALDRIPEHYREVVEPAVCEGKPPREIARDLNRAPGTVRVQLQRGLEHLRRALPEAYTSAGGVLALSTRTWESMRATVLESAGVPAASVPAASSGFLVVQATKVTLTSVPIVLAGVLIAALGLGWWATQEFQSSHPDRALELIEPLLAESGDAHAGQLQTGPDAVDSRQREPVIEQVADVSSTQPRNLIVTTVDAESGDPLQGVHVGIWPDVGFDEQFELAMEHRGVFDLLHNHEAPCLYTDENGRVAFGVPVGIPVIVTATGVEEYSGQGVITVTALDHGEVREATVELRQTVQVHLLGRVVDADSGEPIADVPVRLQRYSRQDREAGLGIVETFETLSEVSTDSKGAFNAVLDIPIAEQNSLLGVIEAPGFGPVFFQTEANREEPAHEKTFELKSSALLHGTLDVVGETSANDYTVRVRAEMAVVAIGGDTLGPFQVFPEWTARVEGSGSWSLENLPAECALLVEVLNRSQVSLRKEEDIVLNSGEERVIDWLLGSGTRIHGRAFMADGGEPLENHTIWLLPEEKDRKRGMMRPFWEPAAIARTDAQGHFEFDDVTPGRWLVGPAAHWYPDDRAVAPLADVVETSDGLTEVEIVIEAHGLYIRGVVRNPSGKPARWPHVSGFSSEGYFVETNGELKGEFSLGPLTPGEYSIWAHGGSEYIESHRVSVETGAAGIILQLNGAGALSGLVVDSVTHQPRVAELSLALIDRGFYWVGFGEYGPTSDEGSFHLDQLRAGTYSIKATADHRVGIVTGVDVRAGTSTEGLVLAMEPAALLILRCEGGFSSIYTEILVSGNTIVTDRVDSGDPEEYTLPAGEVTVRFLAWPDETDELPTIRGELKVQLVAGETAEVTWPLPENDE